MDDFLGIEEYLQFSMNQLVSMTEKKDPFSYLKKGEHLQTLVRKKNREIGKSQTSTFLDVVNAMISKKGTYEATKTAFFRSIRNKLIYPLLNNGLDTSKKQVNFQSFLNLFGEFSKWISLEEKKEGYSFELMQALVKSEVQSAVNIVIKEKKYVAPFGENIKLIPSKNGRSYKLRKGGREYLSCIDFGYFFSFAVAQLQLRQYLQKKWELLTEEEKEKDISYSLLKEELQESLELYLTNGMLQIAPSVGEKTREQLTKASISFQENENGMKQIEFSPIFYLCPDIEIALDFYFIALYEYSDNYKLTSGILFGFESTFFHVFWPTFQIYLSDKEEKIFQKKLSEEYAASYQTKRNIPKKTIEAMENSGFNQYFAYVEFDEKCDLKKMELLYRKFQELAEYFCWGKEEEVSIRFRRLGHHKASGLYYPYLKCLCVDINYPQSLAHEYFHMLDYKYNQLSKDYSFYDIYGCYKEECVKELKKDKTLYKRLNKSSLKYNLAYYLHPTEVFARCGEIYLVRILGIDNSIVQPENGFAYPKSKKLEEKIACYFDSFLKQRVDKSSMQDNRRD